MFWAAILKSYCQICQNVMFYVKPKKLGNLRPKILHLSICKQDFEANNCHIRNNHSIIFQSEKNHV